MLNYGRQAGVQPGIMLCRTHHTRIAILLLATITTAGIAYSQPASTEGAAPATSHSASRPASRPTPYSAPMKVPPIVVGPQSPPTSAIPAPTPPIPPVAIPRPPMVGNCDPGGCWDSNGNRLNRVGPNVIGPRGPCTTVNGIVNCP